MRARRPRSQRIQPTGTLRCPRMKLCVLEVLPKSVRDAARGRMLRLNQNAEVQVYLHLAEVTDDHLRELRAAGAAIEITDAPRRIVQARVPATRLGAVADLPFVQLVRLPN